MPRNQKTRSSGLTAILVKTKKFPDGVVMGLVEQFSITQSLRGELIYAVGRQTAAENVLHGVDRVDVSWGQTRSIKDDELQALGIAPKDVDLPNFDPVTVIFVDNDRGETICEVRDVLPTSIGLSTGAMAKISENFSGSGIQVYWASELN